MYEGAESVTSLSVVYIKPCLQTFEEQKSMYCFHYNVIYYNVMLVMRPRV
jgi:hypothetical protein